MTFHYVSSERIANGDFFEKFSLKKANVLSDAIKTNNFCPRAQLNKLLECCGKPELSRERASPVRTEVSKLHQLTV